MKRPDGVTIIAVWKSLLGAIFGIGACVIVAFAAVLVSQVYDEAGRGVLMLVFGVGALASVALGVANLIAGWGLLVMKDWARWLTIALAILGLFGFPVGTIIGGAIIVYLLTPEAQEAFKSTS